MSSDRLFLVLQFVLNLESILVTVSFNFCFKFRGNFKTTEWYTFNLKYNVLITYPFLEDTFSDQNHYSKSSMYRNINYLSTLVDDMKDTKVH